MTLINESFQALKKLGGTATNKQIKEQVIADIGTVDIDEWRFESGLSWARTELSKRGVIRRVDKGVWSICDGWMDKDTLE